MTLLLEIVNRYPPVLCRMLAREPNRRRTTVGQLAARTNLSPRTVIRLSKRKSWDGVDVKVVSSFMAACGVDLSHTKRIESYIKRAMEQGIDRSFRHLNKKIKQHLAGSL